MKYQQGDVISVPFPFTDLSTSKHRPALVISNNLVAGTDDVIIVMITSQQKTDSINIEITSKDIDITLPKQSFVRCHRLATIDEKIITGKFATITKDFLRTVVAAIQSLVEIK